MRLAVTGTPARIVPLGLAACALLLVAIFLVAHAHYPGVPAAGSETGGWRDWADQGRYIVASRAWARGDLTPGLHWFVPGYPLLGAPFLHITPTDRYLLPDLVCLVGSMFACAALARRIFSHDRFPHDRFPDDRFPDDRFPPGRFPNDRFPLGRFRVGRFASLWGAAAFLVTSVGTLPGLKTWLIPWSTTPTAALTLGAFVAVLRLADRPCVGRALLAGAVIGGITLFRPAEAVPVALAAAVALLPLLVTLRPTTALGIAVAGLLAAAAMTGVTVGLIAATSGFGAGTYYAASARHGFEFRLLPLRWVSLVIDGRPIFDGVGSERAEPGLHRGLAEAFPWMIAGVGGVAACWFGREDKRVLVLLAVWLAAHMAMILSWRDLHIFAFWLYGNYHYFKVAQPVFMLFALVLAVRLADPATRWRAAAAAALAIVALFGWRASLVPMPSPALAPMASADGGVAVPSLASPDEAAIIPGTGSWSAFADPSIALTIGGKRFVDWYDFRLYPRASDFLLVPVRRLPPQPGVLTLAGDVHVTPGAPVARVRQTITFGLPCLFDLAGSAVCGTLGTPLIPAR